MSASTLSVDLLVEVAVLLDVSRLDVELEARKQGQVDEGQVVEREATAAFRALERVAPVICDQRGQVTGSV